MRAVVLCGGLGTRLGPLTREIPKPLMDVAGKPFISYVLDHLAANDTTEIVLAVSSQWQKLRGTLGSS
jgi:D-glycero-alpha-D-manno-heptose 1-phosphate guanylyltransferase